MAFRPAVQSGSSNADPKAPLSDALKNFDEALSHDERKRYHSNCSQPDTQTVLNFVSEIDANNRGQGRRCSATRLMTFLDATQRFLGVVDTFVSSNPKIAALVWGGIKTTILIANNIATYFDKITSLIMDIGRSCPTFRSFGDLFPESAGLQAALCEYFATVVRLCIKIIQESHASRTNPIFRALIPLDATFRPYQDDLARMVKHVQLQISLASEQAAKSERVLLETDRKKNSRFRSSFSQYQKDSAEWRVHAMARQAIKLRIAIKDTLSPVNYAKVWKMARQQCADGTTTWIQRDDSFSAWIQNTKSCIMWCSGNLGTGKTILTSSVVAHLSTVRGPRDKIAYFFCQTEDSTSLSAENIFGSIVSQLLESHLEQAGSSQLEDLYKTCQNFDVQNFSQLLLKVEPGGANYVIIDGLDECEETEIQKASEMMAILLRNNIAPCKIFCTGRSELERLLFQDAKLKYKMTVSGEKVNADIERYIKVTLHEKLEKNRLTLRDPTLILKIQDKLTQGTQGMFLWTRLLIEDICAGETDDDIIEALENLPNGLKGLFRRMKQRVASRNGAARAIKTLQFCGVAKRPLTIEELREALTIKRGQKDLDQGQLVPDFHEVLTNCCSFLFVDEEEQTVHYIHHSAKTYLFTNDIEHDEKAFVKARLDIELGILCMTYLNFGILKGQLARPKNSLHTAIHPAIQPAMIARYALSQNSEQHGNFSGKVAQYLLRHRDRFNSMSHQNIERCFQEALGSIELVRLKSELQSRPFHFLDYAKTNWIFHLKDLNNTDEHSWALFCKCVESSNIADRPWEAGQPRSDSMWIGDVSKQLDWIIQTGHAALSLHYEISTKNSLLMQDGRDLLVHASRQGQIEFVNNLLKDSNLHQSTLARALHAAADSGHLDIVERLLTEVNIVDLYPLMCAEMTLLTAAAKGHLDVVETSAVTMSKEKCTIYQYTEIALHAAAAEGHHEMVDRLLISKPDVNQVGPELTCEDTKWLARQIDLREPSSKIRESLDQRTEHRSALQVAAKGGHLKVVELLLAAKADVNAAGTDYRTALHLAAEQGHFETVERLLEAQADSFRLAGGQTALHLAAERGHLNIVNRLLETQPRGYDTHEDSWTPTALNLAARNGRLEIVQKLLAVDKRSNFRCSNILHAADAARESGHQKVAEMLEDELRGYERQENYRHQFIDEQSLDETASFPPQAVSRKAGPFVRDYAYFA